MLIAVWCIWLYLTLLTHPSIHTHASSYSASSSLPCPGSYYVYGTSSSSPPTPLHPPTHPPTPPPLNTDTPSSLYAQIQEHFLFYNDSASQAATFELYFNLLYSVYR